MVWNNKLNYTGDSGSSVSIYNGKKDFENFGTSPAGILKIKILESRAYVIECISSYTKAQSNKTNQGVMYIKSALNDLFLQVRSMIKKDYENIPEKDNLYNILLKKKESNKFLDLLEAFEFIDDYLLNKKITKIDYVDNYDRTNVTEEDDRNGL